MATTDAAGNVLAAVTEEALSRALQLGSTGEAQLLARILIELQVISYLLREEIRVREDLSDLRSQFATALFPGV